MQVNIVLEWLIIIYLPLFSNFSLTFSFWQSTSTVWKKHTAIKDITYLFSVTNSLTLNTSSVPVIISIFYKFFGGVFEVFKNVFVYLFANLSNITCIVDIWLVYYEEKCSICKRNFVFILWEQCNFLFMTNLI